MPNVKSAEERVRLSQKQRARNVAVKSAVKTAIRRFNELLAEGKKEEATTAYRKASSQLDKAAVKGILSKNAAARRKSRLARKLTTL